MRRNKTWLRHQAVLVVGMFAQTSLQTMRKWQMCKRAVGGVDTAPAMLSDLCRPNLLLVDTKHTHTTLHSKPRSHTALQSAPIPVPPPKQRAHIDVRPRVYTRVQLHHMYADVSSQRRRPRIGMPLIKCECVYTYVYTHVSTNVTGVSVDVGTQGPQGTNVTGVCTDVVTQGTPRHKCYRCAYW